MNFSEMMWMICVTVSKVNLKNVAVF